ncbi:AAA+ family ATPase [Falsigemmobacter faecalis]|uniref:AAA+ family ATPase n=2 Tax=Falsigemmobacter faecalis TaxID=2488730 RepID=A0A3P3DQL9_9RHOB|nr:AAA+ family ATPase [Falsigemmobacter faecalis]
MRTAALVLCLLAAPLAAQQPPAPSGQPDEDGFELLGRGARSLLQSFLGEIDPALRQMQDGMQGLGPMLRDLAALLGDVQHYEAPERLPNGDIVIRRKTGAPPPPARPQAPPEADRTAPDGSIDL